MKGNAKVIKSLNERLAEGRSVVLNIDVQGGLAKVVMLFGREAVPTQSPIV